MKKQISVLFLALCWMAFVKGQNVTVEAKMDSAEMCVGSQTTLHVETMFDAGMRISLPDMNDTVVSGLEIVRKSKPDTSFLNDGKRVVVRQDFVLTSFDTALYYIPHVAARADSTVFASQPLALKVYMMPVDTAEVDNIKGIKEIADAPFVFSDWALMLVCAALFAACVALFVYLLVRLRDNKPIIRKIHITPELLPQEKAMAILDEVNADKGRIAGNAKLFYTKLTEAVRVFVSGRFGFNALEMTSSEVMDKLSLSDKTLREELRKFFATADFVKFAKYSPTLNEEEADMAFVRSFVDAVKIDVPEEQREKPHDIFVEEPRSKRSKQLLVGALVVIFVLGAACCVGLVSEVLNMFF